MSELNKWLAGGKPLSFSGRHRETTGQTDQTFNTYTEILNISADLVLIRNLYSDIRSSGTIDRGVKYYVDGVLFGEKEVLNSSTTSVNDGGQGVSSSTESVACQNVRVLLLCTAPVKANYGVDYDILTYSK